MIKYDYDATASYAGGVAGLAPTSPAVTGVSLKDNQQAVQAYDRHTGELESKITSAVTDAVPSAKIGETFNTAYGGVAARVPADKIGDLLEVNGVVAVQKDSLEQPQSEITPQFVGATDAWPALGGSIHAAENVVVGVIDTGIWPESPFFADRGLPPPPPGGPYALPVRRRQRYGAPRAAVRLQQEADRRLRVHGHLHGDRRLRRARVLQRHDEDLLGTGSDRPRNAHLLDRGRRRRQLRAARRGRPRAGQRHRPGARVIMYRVCLAQGCFSSDSVRAVQQAILDGVDVINYSISGGGRSVHRLCRARVPRRVPRRHLRQRICW